MASEYVFSPEEEEEAVEQFDGFSSFSREEYLDLMGLPSGGWQELLDEICE